MGTFQQGPRQQRVMSYLTDENNVPIARALPRRERLLKLGSGWSTEENETIELNPLVQDEEFIKFALGGLNHRLPERSSTVVRRRSSGTLRGESGGGLPLPRNTGAVRLRQEHAELVDATWHERQHDTFDFKSTQTSTCCVTIVRNALAAELYDLQRMVRSIEVRKFDVCEVDVIALFTWYKLTENFMRLYIVGSERVVYTVEKVERVGRRNGLWNSAERETRKKELVRLAGDVELLRRAMIALGDRCGDEVQRLRRRVDRLCSFVMQFMDEEVETVEHELQKRLTQEESERMCDMMVGELRSGTMGREMVMLLSRGLDAGKTKKELWLKRKLGAVSRMGVQLSLRRFHDRHTAYVALFEAAEAEYRVRYRDLSNLLDESVRSVTRAMSYSAERESSSGQQRQGPRL